MKFNINPDNSFIKQVINECVEKISQVCSCDLVLSDIFDIEADIKNVDVTVDCVVLYVSDHLYAEEQVNSKNKLSKVESLIYEFANNNPNIKQIILMHEHFPYDLPITKLLTNVSTVHVSFLMYGRNLYPKLLPVDEKNFNSTQTTVCLNRLMRPHRVVLLSYLNAINLNSNTYMTANINFHSYNSDPLDFINWDFEDFPEFKEQIRLGFTMIEDNAEEKDNDIYETIGDTATVVSFDNATNFDNKLRHIYTNTFVEIINETLYDYDHGMVSEKYLNSVYGYNFPIIISTVNTVKHLRNIGFDMFDDIIDHSYDSISDPCKRMISCIQLNIDILSNPSIAKDKWRLVKNRFDNNLDFTKDQMYKNYQKVALTATDKILSKL